MIAFASTRLLFFPEPTPSLWVASLPAAAAAPGKIAASFVAFRFDPPEEEEEDDGLVGALARPAAAPAAPSRGRMTSARASRLGMRAGRAAVTSALSRASVSDSPACGTRAGRIHGGERERSPYNGIARRGRSVLAVIGHSLQPQRVQKTRVRTRGTRERPPRQRGQTCKTPPPRFPPRTKKHLTPDPHRASRSPPGAIAPAPPPPPPPPLPARRGT